jgi:glucose-1-phosphate thymidylyltransferase
MKCLILAGGFGTRLFPLTIHQAKALIEYKGKPLLSHIVDSVPDGLDILISCNRRFQADFQKWQKATSRDLELCVEDVWTEEQKKGAVGSLGFWIESKNITDDLLVIAGDNYFEFNLGQFIAAYNGKNALVAIYALRDSSKASQYGVVELQDQRIINFEEKPARPKSSLIATAIYILPPRIFPLLSRYCAEGKRDNLGSFIAYLISQDEVHAYTFSGNWVDIGSQIEIA